MHAKEDYLALDDAALLTQCDQHTYKSSGPGGQHRNKVSSAVRLRHGPTGITAHGDDSRSQHENRELAISRLRMNLACRLRRPVEKDSPLPDFIAEMIFTVRGGQAKGASRMQIGRKDFRFWRAAAFLLDVLESCRGQISAAGALLGITTSNFVALLQQDRHLLAAAQAIRKAHGLKPIL